MLGDSFRSKVAELLKIQFTNVKEEFHLLGKNADIVFELVVPPNTREVVAVECKDWNRTLQSADISKIVSEYRQALDTKQIQRLWIVASLELGAMPKETMESYGGQVSFLSYADFERTVVLDFQQYLKFLVDDFQNDILSQLYVPTHSSDGTAIHIDIVLPWLAELNAKPLAVISGYGTGKTSYARFLASYLAKAALTQPFSRIPIYIALGQLTQHQSLRGLINSMFSDEFALRGYNYALFDKLNRAGRFLFILDGFDEMKHAMKKRDIFDNFKDIKTIVPEKAKLVLFGRPDVFHSEDESLIALGKQKIGDSYLEDPNKLQFDCVNLRFFTKDELRSFFSNYLDSYILRNFENYPDPDGFVQTRKYEIELLLDSDIVSRPVHAKMLGDLAVIPGHRLSDYNEYDLYKNFVEKTIDREGQKPARTGVMDGARLVFVRRLAWWLWTQKKVNSFAVDEIPQTLKSFCLESCYDAPDEEAAVREFVTGSIVEPKSTSGLLGSKRGIYFFFPHKSYWEFLVAEYLCSSDLSRAELVSISESVNEEIVNFAGQRRDKSALDDLLNRYTGVHARLSANMCSIFFEAQSFKTRFKDGGRFGPGEWWGVVIEILYIHRHPTFEKNEKGHIFHKDSAALGKLVLGNRFDLDADFGSAILSALGTIASEGEELAALLVAFVLLSFDTTVGTSRVRQHISLAQRDGLQKIMSTIYTECFFVEPESKNPSIKINLVKVSTILEGSKGTGNSVSVSEKGPTLNWVVVEITKVLKYSNNNNETREMNRLLDSVQTRRAKSDE
jgi:NACHT domain